MSHHNSRQEILQRIARVAGNRTGSEGEVTYNQEDIYKPVEPDALMCFKRELETISGQCVICDEETDVYNKLAALMQAKGLPFLFTRDLQIAGRLKQHGIAVETDEKYFPEVVAGVTPCAYLVARTGSVVVTSSGNSGRQMHAFPPIHIILAKKEQLVSYLEEALDAVRQQFNGKMPSAITVITGPSRTADIEKTLVLGAHGPKELIIFVQQN
ncbi:Lactate utilization protein C [bioreactor metagenome]|jgi:L-lactate dehydrogenase complex protein LldG|uniref:Lactate utilization protein C n=1 Tax=bioreactor metagenome TaxID=1076179 RepID=A0A644VK91_9ZZZZ|nr:LUD domain-containing protein [Paludibacter sp.]